MLWYQKMPNDRHFLNEQKFFFVEPLWKRWNCYWESVSI